MQQHGIGLAGIGVFLPAGVQTAAEVAAAAGLPDDVVEAKMGLRQKRRAGAGAGEQLSAMAARAAAAALMHAGVTPGDLDMVIFHGSQHKEWPVWSAAAHIQHQLGARRAVAFEIYALCAGAPVALKTAADMMWADPDLRRVLLVTATREGDLVDYANPRARFLYNLGDGAAAAVLTRGHGIAAVLGSSLRTDGSFAMDVVIPPGQAHLDVADPAGMKRRLDPISLPHFLGCIDAALGRSGCQRSDVRFLAATHMKRSIHQRILLELGLDWHQTCYLEDYGHLQSADQYLALHLAMERGLLRRGDVVVLAAAGLGYTWGATILRWE